MIVSIRVPDSLADELDAEARSRGVSRSRVLRDRVRQQPVTTEMRRPDAATGGSRPPGAEVTGEIGPPGAATDEPGWPGTEVTDEESPPDAIPPGATHRPDGALTDEIRPPVAVIDRLVALVAAGNHITVACGVVGISTESLDAWMDADDALADRVQRAQAEGEARNVALIARAATDSWQAAAWLLERSAPERWGRPARRAETPAPGPPNPVHDPFAEVDELARRRRP